jgi:multisubunit Na+/H+ antiporter MnhG subunit
MQPEKKAAIKAGGTTALVAGAVALLLPSPVAWAAVIYGSYKMAKDAYQRSKGDQVQQDYWNNH